MCVQGKKGRGKESGNGRMIVSKFEEDDSGCKWATQKVINVPKTANFRDYSDMDVHHSKEGPVARIAITSQVPCCPILAVQLGVIASLQGLATCCVPVICAKHCKALRASHLRKALQNRTDGNARSAA